MPAAGLKLESAEAAAEVLAGYDRATRTWRFPMVGEFWDAVRDAHRRGHRGAGRRIAIVDSPVDYGFDAIREAADGPPRMPPRFGEATDHGTAVALLILTVAPEARLAFYPVTAGGDPDPYAVAEALRRIAASNVDAVCMSLGQSVAAIPPYNTADLGAECERVLANAGREVVEPPACPSPACLCQAAAAAASGSRALFAAAGNTVGEVSCPAVSDEVVAVGFQRDVRWRAGGDNAAFGLPPSYSQSTLTDLSLKQPEGVLGSSFAAPLAAGAAVLGMDPALLRAFAASCRLCAHADLLMGLFRRRALPPPMLPTMMQLYQASLQAQPHLQALVESDHWCMACALYSTPLLINGALANLMAEQFAAAELLLRAARRLAPDNPHAMANLARVLYAKFETSPGDPDLRAGLDEAAALYDAAVARQPGSTDYDAVRAAIAAHRAA